MPSSGSDAGRSLAIAIISTSPEFPFRSFIENPPGWLIELAPRSTEEIPLLDPGEIAAINLALEIRADLLLIDGSLGRKAAVARGIHIVGTIGILEQAADLTLIDLKDAFFIWNARNKPRRRQDNPTHRSIYRLSP